ncbi:MAG TPA: acyl-CoA reductase [Polyangiaceae bacterium]|nr:acyl-CoA reductase [Polyangiaceae bacterium]
MNDFEYEVRRARLEPLFESARSLADASSARGQQARERLAVSSGLSPQGVDFALQRCLETSPSEAEIAALIRSTPSAQVAHVLLSANVFVAAHRAIAIALAASAEVRVRASRREPEMAELLLAGAPGAFQLVNELSPHPGDRLWAYGSDETMADVATTLPPGVALHAHGSGFGVALLEGSHSVSELGSLLSALAEDIALFDQRGCLSPRVLLVNAEPTAARSLASELATQLASLERRVPRGELTAHELSEIVKYRDTAYFAFEVFEAGSGFVTLSHEGSWLMPPTGRNIHVLTTADPIAALARYRPMLTSCAFAGEPARRQALRCALPGARVCGFGEMQRPPFDGPVDRREL